MHITDVKWDITYSCNLNCIHCGVPASRKFVKGELGFSELVKIVDMLAESGVKTIKFLGGEPFVRRDFMKLLEYISNNTDISYGFVTNGTLMSRSIVEALTKLRGLSGFSLSIDGVEEVHDFIRGRGVFQKVKNLLDIIDEQVRAGNMAAISVNTVLMGVNLDRIDELLEFLSKHEVSGIYMLPVGIYGNAKLNEHIVSIPNEDKLIKTIIGAILKLNRINLAREISGRRPIVLMLNYYPIKLQISLANMDIPLKWVRLSSGSDGTCGAGVRSVYISPDGNVWPCDMVLANLDEISELLNLGNFSPINALDLSNVNEILDYDYFLRITEYIHSEDILRGTACFSCKYLKSCYVCPIYKKFREKDERYNICTYLDEKRDLIRVGFV